MSLGFECLIFNVLFVIYFVLELFRGSFYLFSKDFPNFRCYLCDCFILAAG